tara:strand:+ start:81 stop:230 length:150 start_codon:yes stop_codon:yes gene_type:complete
VAFNLGLWEIYQTKKAQIEKLNRMKNQKRSEPQPRRATILLKKQEKKIP